MTHDLYICHSTRDKAIADAVCAALEASGLKCWIAPRDVLQGSDWASSILDAISGSRAVVLIFSSNANESAHVKRDVHRAIQIGLPLLPLRVDDSAPSDIFAYFGSAFRWIDATSPPLEQHLVRLAEAARATISGAPRSAISPVQASAHIDGREHYDVFISYRREGGASDARAIRERLLAKNIRTFLDVDDLRAGHYDAELLRQIERAPNFIVILSLHSLERCSDPQDWLRQEIAQAVKTERNIIPIIMPGFRFPIAEELPEDIRALRTHNGLEYSHKYFNAMIDDLLSYLRTENSGNEPMTAEGSSVQETPEHSRRAEENSAVPGLTFARLVIEPDSLVGQRIDKYAIREFVGAGGSGLVYRAVRPALGQEVCIKVFYPLSAEGEDLGEIIVRGARALAAMNHPNIVKVFDLESFSLSDATSFCLVMEFVRGCRLDEWSLNIAASETTLFTELLSGRLRMALDITRALAAAHSCRYTDDLGFEQTGILHGDIKPGNIIVRGDNSPVILDFMMVDIQRLLDPRVVSPDLMRGREREPITAAYGTPGFMAPEQDRDGIVTIKSDIFSLGVTFAHLFFPGVDNRSGNLFGSEQDARLDCVRCLVMEMMAQDPEERPRDLQEVARKLDGCAEVVI